MKAQVLLDPKPSLSQECFMDMKISVIVIQVIIS